MINPHYVNRRRNSLLRKVLFVGITIFILVAFLHTPSNSLQPIDTADHRRRLPGDQLQVNGLDQWAILGVPHGATQDAIRTAYESLPQFSEDGETDAQSEKQAKAFAFVQNNDDQWKEEALTEATASGIFVPKNGLVVPGNPVPTYEYVGIADLPDGLSGPAARGSYSHYVLDPGTSVLGKLESLKGQKLFLSDGCSPLKRSRSLTNEFTYPEFQEFYAATITESEAGSGESRYEHYYVKQVFDSKDLIGWLVIPKSL